MNVKYFGIEKPLLMILKENKGLNNILVIM